MDPVAIPPFVLVFVGALALYFLPRRLGFSMGILSVISAGFIIATLSYGTYHEYTVFGVFDVVLFRLDVFNALIGVIFALLGSAALLYSYASELPEKTAAVALFYMASTFGALFAGDWLTLLIFAELMAVTSTVLVWQYGGEAVRAAYRYALAHGIAGTLMFMGVAWHYISAGSLELTATGIASGWPTLLMILGIGINCGFIGLHMWLPDTYPRPHFAASVFLSVFTTKTSAYILFRIFPEGGAALALAYMGGAMAIYGVIFALLQHNMRALLSYHIQAQMGYMIAGIGLGLYLGGEALNVGVGGATAHLVNNILFKSLLFMAVGVIIYRTGIENLYELGGLYKVMPLTFAAFLLGALSITAVPGFNGFISKGLILDAANPVYFGGGNTVIYWMLMIGAVGTFLSFIKLGYYVFLHNKPELNVQDANRLQTVSMLFIGGFCLLLGVHWTAFVEKLPLLGADIRLQPYSAGHLQDALMLSITSLVVFKIIRKPLSSLHISDPASLQYPLIFHLTELITGLISRIYGPVDNTVKKVVRKLYSKCSDPESFESTVNTLLQRDEDIRPGAGLNEALLIVVTFLTLMLALFTMI